MQTYKIIQIQDKKYKINFPSVGESSEADIEYSKAYTRSLKDGLLPRAAMEREIEKNNLWPSEHQKDLEEATKKIQDVVVQIKQVTNKEESTKLKEDFIIERNKIILLNSAKQSLYNHTAESKGEEAKIAWLSYRCILNEDETRVWETLEKFKNERDAELVSELVQAFVGFTSGLDDKVSEVESLLNTEVTPSEEILGQVEEPQI